MAEEKKTPEQITETDPNDSTAAKFLIIACSLAIF